MENAEQIIADLRRRLSAEKSDTQKTIDATQFEIDELPRVPCRVEELTGKLIEHCRGIASRGAARILQLTDHSDLQETNIETHFAGALLEVLFYVFEKEISMIIGERLAEIWPANGIGAEDRKAKLDDLTKRLSTLNEIKASVERQLLAAGGGRRVLSR